MTHLLANLLSPKDFAGNVLQVVEEFLGGFLCPAAESLISIFGYVTGLIEPCFDGIPQSVGKCTFFVLVWIVFLFV